MMPADRPRWFILIGLPLFILMTLSAGFFLIRISELRQNELRLRLLDVRGQTDRTRAAGILKNFLRLRNLGNKSDDTKQKLESETQMLALLNEPIGSIWEPAWYDRMAIALAQTVQWSLGQQMLPFKSGKTYSRLDKAFFLEIRREFKTASDEYLRQLPDVKEQDLLDTARLHLGYCLALSGINSRALEQLKKVNAEAEDPGIKFVALALAKLIKDGQKLQLKIDKMDLSVNKGKMYLQIQAWEEAIKTMDDLIHKKGKKTEYLFYRGRAFEESGKITEAITDYNEVINKKPDSKYAKSANRRMYLLGAFYEKDKKLKDKALAVAEEIHDTSLKKHDDTWKDILASSNTNSASLKSPVEIPVEKNIPKVERTKKKKKVENKTGKKEKESTADKIPTVQQLLDPSLTKDQRKEMLIRKYSKVDKIFTTDGNIFVGAVYNETGKEIRIITSFGSIKIPQDKVTMRLKVSSKAEIK